MATMQQSYVFAVVCGRSGVRTHVIASPALPFDVELHSPLCGAHFRAEPVEVHMGLVTCSKCASRLVEMVRRGCEVRWVDVQEDGDGAA